MRLDFQDRMIKGQFPNYQNAVLYTGPRRFLRLLNKILIYQRFA